MCDTYSRTNAQKTKKTFGFLKVSFRFQELKMPSVSPITRKPSLTTRKENVLLLSFGYYFYFFFYLIFCPFFVVRAPVNGQKTVTCDLESGLSNWCDFLDPEEDESQEEQLSKRQVHAQKRIGIARFTFFFLFNFLRTRDVTLKMNVQCQPDQGDLVLLFIKMKSPSILRKTYNKRSMKKKTKKNQQKKRGKNKSEKTATGELKRSY